MFAKRTLAVIMAVVLMSSVAVGAAFASSGTSSEADASSETYAGTHLSFETTGDALASYTVSGDQLITSVEVESASDAQQRGLLGVGVALVSVTNVQASALEVSTESQTSVHVTSDTGATFEAHDSPRGHLLVRAEDDGQVVTANVSSDAEVEQASDGKVVVTKDDGTQATFIVIGDGDVTVNEDGHVTAKLEQGSTLAYQQYDDERDERREALLADGTVAAEVYVTVDAEGDGELVADVVQYGQDTTVEILTHSENEVHLTAERAESEGRIIITSVSEQAMESAGDLEVMVDGEAATQVESMSELEAAAAGGENSAYMVRHASTADASAEVLVAVNHFSERDIVMQTDGDSPDDDENDGVAEENPGFGAAIAGIAIALAAIIAARRY